MTTDNERALTSADVDALERSVKHYNYLFADEAALLIAALHSAWAENARLRSLTNVVIAETTFDNTGAPMYRVVDDRPTPLKVDRPIKVVFDLNGSRSTNEAGDT